MSAVRSHSEERACAAVRQGLVQALRAKGLPFDVTDVTVAPSGRVSARFVVEFSGELEPAGPAAITERWVDLLRDIVLRGMAF